MLLFLNKFFKRPAHPFNMQNDGTKTYAQWQYEKGANTIEFYTQKYTAEEMFKGKKVLDVGCGAGGKSLYYASLGAKKVSGIEVVAHYEQEALGLAKEKGLEDRFEFVCGDAARMPFEDNSFDTIIVNDAMEHVDEPEKVLQECLRVLVPKGRVFINFPPYYHPYGAHLSDAIGIPWVHLFFTERALINGYKELVRNLPDGQKRIDFRISKDKHGNEYFSYINRMTIKRFKKIIQGKNVVYYKEEPLRNILKPISYLPLFKELFVKMVVCVVEK